MGDDKLNDLMAMVERFNRDIIGLTVPDQPTPLKPGRALMRFAHLEEELTETKEAYDRGDFSETVDGLVDLIYVALGSILEMGVPAGAAFEEVHAANMRRVRGRKSTRKHSDGFDAVKPEGWTGPDFTPMLSLTRDEIQEAFSRKVHCDNGRIELPPLRLLLLGYARHGKDTVAEILKDKYDFDFMSSSMFCAARIIYPALAEKYGYTTVTECFEDRVNHRQEWYDLISAFNADDPARLGRELFEYRQIYCGLRSKKEFNALRNEGVFDISIWVDRSDVLPDEDKSSCTVEPWMADYTIDNNGTLEELEREVERLMTRIGVEKVA